MTMAATGETRSEIIGTATAKATMLRAFRRTMVRAGGDNSITGNSVHIDIDHRATGLNPAINAAPTGLSRGAQNDSATSRRSGSLGHTISTRADDGGRAAASV